MIFKTIFNNIIGIPSIGKTINEINSLKLDATNITGYAAAIKGLSLKQAELVLSTKGLNAVQQEAILTEAGLLSKTGKLTTAELNAILVNKKRTKDQAEALLIKTGLITAETAETTATNVVTAAKLKELVQTKALTQAEANLIATKAGVTLANQKESASLLTLLGSKIKGAGTSLKGLGTGILTIASAHPVIAGVTAAITLCGGAALVNKIKQEKAAKAIKEAYEEAKSAIDEINNTYSTNTSQTKEIAKEYAELAQGVELLTNKNKSLSTEKYERFLELSRQLSTLYPSLTKDFDANGVAILDLSGDVDTIVSSLDDLIDRQRVLANQEIVKQIPDLFAGYSSNVSNYKKQVENAEKTKEDIEKAYDFLNTSLVRVFDVNGTVKSEDDFGKKLYYKISDYTNALKALGISFEDSVIEGTTNHLIKPDFSDLSELHDIYVSAINKAIDDVEFAKQKLDSEKSSINQYLNTWLQEEFSYNQVKDSGLQKAINEMLFNFDWDTLLEGIDKNDWDAVSEYLRRNILFAINNVQNDPEISKALSQVFSNPELTPDEKANYLNQIADYFGNDNIITISLVPVIEETGNLQRQYENAMEKLRNRVYDVWGKGFENPRAKSALTEQLNSFLDKNGIDTPEEIQKFLDLTAGVETLTEAIARYNQEVEKAESPSSLTFTDDQVKAIDDYKSDLKTLQTALEDLDNTDVTDLITKFNDYDWSAYQSGAKTLEEVINELAERALNNLSSSLGNTADMFKYLYDEIFDAEAKLSSLEAELTKNTNEFNGLQEAIDKVKAGHSFSADEISSLINTYSELADKIIITADGYSIEESALSSLADSNKAANNKIIAAEIKSTETVIEQTKAKINALKITLDAYNQVANAWNGGYGDNEAAEGNKQLLEAEAKLSGLLERLKNLQGRFLESETSSASGSAKSASEFAESVDWLSQSIEALEANVDGLNDTFGNAKGYDEQIKSIDNLIAGQKELQSAYDTTSKTYDSLYKDKLDKLKALGLSDKEVQQVHNRINGLSADKLRELYDSGNISSLFEDFKGKGDNSTAEKLYNEIQDAINIAQQKLDNQQNFLKIGVELDKNALQKLELSRDNNQAKADVINAKLDDDELTDRLKLKLLGQLQKQTEALYNDEIAIAKANKDTNEQKKLEIERAKELRDIESQRNEILNGSVDAMIARHERKIRDIQNVIDETGRATFEQYQAMIAEGDAQTRLYEQKVAQAQSEIQLLESRGINSGEAYNDAVENLGKCKDELSECIQKTKDWHTAILNLNIENINKVLDSFGDKLDIINKDLNDVNKSMSDYEDYISAAQYVVQQQIDAQNELKESLQNQLDTLQDSNEARQQALNLQKALWELEKAKNQKTVKVYREGQGYIYEADQNAVRTAQENYDNALYNNKVYQIQTQIDGIDDYISSLSKIQDKWGNITKEIENASNLAKTMAKYGNDFAVKVISGDASFMQGIVDIVTSLNRQKDSLEQSQERIESLKSTFNDMKDDMEDWVKSYEESGISFEETVQKMKGVVEDVYPSISQAIKQEGINITRYIQEILNSFGDDVSEGIKLGVDTAMSGAVTGALIGSGIYDNLQDVKNNVKESGTVIGDNLNKIVKDTSKSYDKITNIIKDELNEQESIISDSTDTVSDYFTSMANQTTEALDGLVSEMQRVAKETSDLATQIRNSTSVSSVGEISSPVIGGMLGAGIGTNLIKPPIYHNGIEKGFIGGEKFNSKKKELFKLLGIKELKPNEELAILQKGEAVFNEKQQAMVLRNFQSVLERSIIPPEIPNYDFTKEQQLPSVNVEFGANSIVLNEVNSGEELIKEMTSRIKPIFMQTFSSINRY